MRGHSVPKDHAIGHIRLMLKEAHLTGRLTVPLRLNDAKD